MIISFSILYFLLLYAVIFIAYVGWGKIFSSFVNIRLEGNGICFSSAWLGWSLSLVIFHSIHLFYPLTPAISGLFFLIGIFLYLRKKGHAQQPSSIVRVSKTYVATLLVFSFCVASYAIMSPDVYDSGLYHFNSIRWLQEYAIVPGLGNLHGRLAYNNTFFGYIASLNAFPPFSYGHNLGNSFLLILVFAECLYPIFHRRAQNSHVSQLVIITKVCLIPLILVYSIDDSLSSPTPDIASALIRIVLFYNFITLLEQVRHNHSPTAEIKYVMILATAALTLKLSNAMYATVLILISVFFCYSLRKKIPLKNYLGTFSFILFCMVLWMGRGVVVSGCPLYPSSAFCLDLEWTVSAKQIEDELTGIKGYRKAANNEKIDGGVWIKFWFAKMSQRKGAFLYPLLLSLLSTFCGIASIIYSSTSNRPNNKRILLIAMIPLWAAVLFWFVMSPGLRFAEPFFFLLSLAGFLPILATKNQRRGFTIGLAGITILVVNLPIIFSLVQYRPTLKLDLFSGAEPVRVVKLNTFRTNSELEIYTPIEGNQCWDSSLPASPYRNPLLSLRKQTVSSGFIIQQVVFPKQGAPP